MTSVRSVIDRLSREGRVTDANGVMHELFPVAIPVAEGEALRGMIVRERATRTIETGLGFAFSTLYICDGLAEVGPGGRHVAIDPFQTDRFGSCGLRVLADAGASDMVEHIAGRSELVLPRLVDEGRRFDLAFVDGNHRFDGVFLDLSFLGRLLEPGSVVFIDDYQLPGVERAVAFFVTNLGWVVETISPEDPLHRWVVLRTSTAPDERAYDFFVPF